jgi:hypothetical protein
MFIEVLVRRIIDHHPGHPLSETRSLTSSSTVRFPFEVSGLWTH